MSNNDFSGRLRVTRRLLICFSLMSVLSSLVMAQDAPTSKKSQNSGKPVAASARASGPQWMKSSHRGWVSAPNGAKSPANVRLASLKTQEEPSNTPASSPPPVPTPEPVNDSASATTTPFQEPAPAVPPATTSATDAKQNPGNQNSPATPASEQAPVQKTTSPDASSSGTEPPIRSIKEQLKASFLNQESQAAPNAPGLSGDDEDLNSDDPVIRERAKELQTLQERLRRIIDRQRQRQAQPPVVPTPGPQPEPAPPGPDPHPTPQPDPHLPTPGPKPELHPVVPEKHSEPHQEPPHPEPHLPVPGPKPEPHPPGPDVPPQPHPEPHPPGPNPHPENPSAETTTIQGTIDHLGLANNLFALGQFDLALDVYQQADASTLTPQQQFWVEYQQACCLRRLGRSAEASNRYRRLADKPEAGSLSELSQWWVTTLEKKRQLEKKLASHPHNATPAEHVSSDLHTTDPHGVVAPLKSTPEVHSDPHQAQPNGRTDSGHATDHSDHKEDTHGGPKH